jgi:O-acetyl-ADP-ribose deacetylase (regulator of RNase III)
MHREYQLGDCRLKIFLGDITDLAVDAIVNSENSDLIMDAPDGASVSAALRRRSHRALPEEVEALGPLQLGRAVMTAASGSLRCRYLIHAAVVQRSIVRGVGGADTTSYESSVEALAGAVRSSLELAGALGLSSIAFPAFGVRAAAIPKEVSSEVMIAQVVKIAPTIDSLREVIVALLDPESFLVFFERAITRHAEYNAPLELTMRRRGGEIEAELAGAGPVIAHGRCALDHDLLTDLGVRFAALQRSAQHGAHEAPTILRSLGGFIWNFVFPSELRGALSSCVAANLCLRLADDLAALPVELAWDGHSFLCERFRIGRQISSPRPLTSPPKDRTRRALIMTDPRGDLDGARGEAVALFSVFSEAQVDVELRGGERVSRLSLLSERPAPSVLHYCGHAAASRGDAADIGWLLADTAVEVSEVAQAMGATGLVFVNACGADGGGVLGTQACLTTARAFLEAGARHVIVNLWPIADGSAKCFAVSFYRALVMGHEVGEALRTARATLREGVGPARIDWAGYLHFGDPRARVFGERWGAG